MSLKRLIAFHKQYLRAANYELTLPGEPLIYSAKIQVCKRFFKLNYFRNKKWFSIMKCCFKGAMRSNPPVVLLVRFFVSPPSALDISLRALQAEKTPATDAFEIAEYIISFMEMLKGCLIKSYRQIVKIDAEKYYSDKPRTVMKFIHYDDYKKLRTENLIEPAAEELSPVGRQSKLLQPISPAHDRLEPACPEPVSWRAFSRTIGCILRLSDTLIADQDQSDPVFSEQTATYPTA